MGFSLDSLAAFYKDSLGLRFAVERERARIRFAMDTNALREVRFMAILPNDRTLLCLTFLPIKIPEAQRAAVGEFLHRANYGLHLGNFEFDPAEGVVRYKAAAVCGEDDTLSGEALRRVTYVGFAMFDRYVPALMGILYSGLTPEQAIAKAEGRDA